MVDNLLGMIWLLCRFEGKHAPPREWWVPDFFHELVNCFRIRSKTSLATSGDDKQAGAEMYNLRDPLK